MAPVGVGFGGELVAEQRESGEEEMAGSMAASILEDKIFRGKIFDSKIVNGKVTVVRQVL